jgi:steroid delta-isomerase-like uncharacterized protein
MAHIDTLKQAYELWNNRDFDATVAFVAPDIVHVDHANGTVEGREGLKAHLIGLTQGNPDIRIDMDTIEHLETDDWVITRFTARGTNTEPFNGIPPTGKAFALDVCEHWHFNADGLADRSHSYADNLGVMMQLGLIPAEMLGAPA